LIRLWDATTGKPLGKPLEHAAKVTQWAFSPDGKVLLTLVEGETLVRLWDLATGKPLGKPLEHPKAVQYAAFSIDGQTIAARSADDEVRTWWTRMWVPQFDPMPQHLVAGILWCSNHRYIQSKQGAFTEWSTGKFYDLDEGVEKQQPPPKSIREAAPCPD